MHLNSVCENVHLAGSGCMRMGIFKQDMWGSLWMVYKKEIRLSGYVKERVYS